MEQTSVEIDYLREDFNILAWFALSGMSGWRVLDLVPILFIKYELQYGHLAPFHNSGISFHKISTVLILWTSVATGKQSETLTSILCSKQFYFFFNRDV